MITSFVAIFQILNNDFNGSKGLWILISLMAFIGPILYLVKGRKLILKKDYKDVSNRETFSLKKYYLGLIEDLNINVKMAFAFAISLIAIGYLVTGLDIYFFWESKSIGYAMLLILIAIFLRKDITTRKTIKAKTVWSHIGFWIIIFVLFTKLLLMIILPNSEAYKAAKKYLNNDSILIKEIGEIKSFSILPDGGISISSGSQGTNGTATVNLIIKGAKKYKERTLYLEKTPEKDWSVIGIE